MYMTLLPIARTLISPQVWPTQSLWVATIRNCPTSVYMTSFDVTKLPWLSPSIFASDQKLELGRPRNEPLMWMCLYTLLCIAPFKCNYITIKGRTTKLKRLTFLFGPDDALEVIKLWRLWYLLAKRTEYFCHLCDSCMALLYAWSLISTGSATLLTEGIVIGYTLLRLTRPIMRLEKPFSLRQWQGVFQSNAQWYNGAKYDGNNESPVLWSLVAIILGSELHV